MTSIPPLQARRALSGGYGGCSCQEGIAKPLLTSCEAACVHEEVAIADSECPLYICESDYIQYTGGASYKVLNEEKFREDILRGYQTAVVLCANRCWNISRHRLRSQVHRKRMYKK